MPQRILHEACASQENLLVYGCQIHNLLEVLFLHHLKIRGFGIELPNQSICMLVQFAPTRLGIPPRFCFTPFRRLRFCLRYCFRIPSSWCFT